jgi:LacI family transcriptional regulator
MDDVAQRAGVGLATVGRVLHNKGYVSPATRRAVEDAIRDLKYVPNLVARSLKRRESRLWGHLTVFSPNQLFAGISAGVEAAAAAAGYRLSTVTTLRDTTPLADQLRDLVEQQVEGLIVTSHVGVGAELLEPAVRAGIPVVMIERTLRLPGVDRVVVRDFRGAFDAVGSLLAAGHRRIGFVGLRPVPDVETRRWEGYCRALKVVGLGVQAELAAFADNYEADQGYAAFGRLLDGGGPTAVFFTSDVLAAGALQWAYEHGLRVPSDVSMVGYDNTLAAFLAPALNSMGLPLAEIGQHAARLLLSRRADPGLRPRTLGVSPVMVDRGTVKGWPT